jgi:hypothetical protein
MEYDELLESTARFNPSWLAGFFDGEGSVHVKSCDSHSIRLSVNITNTDLRSLTLIAIKFSGGGPYPVNGKKEHKKLYQVCWSGKSARDILEYIKDYSIIKRERILLGIRMAELTGHRGHDVSEENKKEREEIGMRITEMNDSSRRIIK